MIRNFGLLKQENASMANEAFNVYRDRDPAKSPSRDIAAKFRAAYCHAGYRDAKGKPTIDSTPIECFGVWDTVGALGLPVDILGINHHQYAFHDSTLSKRVHNAFHALAIDERRKPFASSLFEQPKEDANAKVNWLEQAWFSGVHSSVGGGCSDSSLSDLSFSG